MNPLDLAQLAYGGFQTIQGLFEQNDAERLAETNVRPVAKTANLYDDLVSRFAGESQYGIDRNARSFANENINNNFSAGLSAMLMAGGNANSAVSLYGASTQATQNLAVQDSERRWQKVNALAGIVDKQNEAKIQDWLYNEDAPYKDKARLAAQKQMMGYNQAMTGVDYTMGALTRGAKHYQDALPTKPGGTDNSFTPENTSDLFQGQNMDGTQADNALQFNGSLPNSPYTWQSDATPVVQKPTGVLSFTDRLIGDEQVPMGAAANAHTPILQGFTPGQFVKNLFTDISRGKIIGYEKGTGKPIYR